VNTGDIGEAQTAIEQGQEELRRHWGETAEMLNYLFQHLNIQYPPPQ
jgi:uncharacterized membrane-anchored protein YhcB (DUF1043 family)